MSTSPVHPLASEHRLRLVRRRWKSIAVLTLLVSLSALGSALLREKQYTATAKILFRDSGLDEAVFGTIDIRPSRDPAREAATNVKLVGLEQVARRTEEALRNGSEYPSNQVPLTSSEITRRMRIAPEGQSDLVSASFTYRSPTVAALVVNTFADQYVAFRRDADRQKIQEARQLVESKLADLSAAERTSAEGQRLEERGQQLDILSSLQTGNAEVVQRADAPDAPSSPSPVQNALLGLIFGGLFGVVFAWLREQLDRRLRDAEDVEELFGVPPLAVIPRSRIPRKPRGDSVDGHEAEAFMMLRATLRYFNVKQPLRSVLVTSSAPGEGKTYISCRLSAAAAVSGASVLLVEADLRRPRMAEELGLSATRGLSTLLSGQDTVGNVLQQVDLAELFPGFAAQRSFDVIAAGPLPPNPADLLESDQFAEFLRLAESRYDLVVIDTPPTAIVSDAIPLMQKVSGVLPVLRLGHSSRLATERLRNQLQNLGARVLGVVANDETRRKMSSYDYGPYTSYRSLGRLENSESQGKNGAAPVSRADAQAAVEQRLH